MKKPFWRRWWMIAIGVLVVIGIGGAVAGGGSESEEASDTTEAADEPNSGESTDDTESTSLEESVESSVETEPSEAPNDTESPDTSAAPAPPVAAETGTGLAAPAPVGTTVQVGDWRVRVIAVTPEASAVVAAANEFNDPPGEGKQFYMATLEATYVGAESSSFWLDVTLKTIGASNVAYEPGLDASCGVLPNEISNSGEAFPGGTVTGNACWSVNVADAAALTLIAEPGFSFDDDDRRFLSMDPTATPVDDPTTTGAPTPQGISGVPIGEAVQAGDWTIKVVSVTPDASAEIAAANQFNEPPAEGRQFFMATLEATYTGTESSTFWVDMNLKAVGVSSVAYQGGFDTDCGVTPSAIIDAGETFPGGTITGNVCWSINSSDAATLTMLADPSFSFDNDQRQAFSLV